MSPGLILVVDDDEDIVRFVEVNLRLEGFEVVTAGDGEQAWRTALEARPDLVLVDVMMPRLDGVGLVQRLRADGRTRYMSIIMLTAKSLSADKVVGLTAGADDYMIKPFDPVELVARVKSALLRAKEMRDVNPLTRLPGNIRVQEEVSGRIAQGEELAVMYIDIDNFKAYNDHYGFLRGDEVIKELAEAATRAVREVAGDDGTFVGHVGGDDVVAIVPPEHAEATAKRLIELWDALVPGCYEDEDVARGYIEVRDRRNELHRFPLMTLSIGIATSASRPLNSHWEAAEIATEMKRFAKREERSNYAVDRRSGDGG